MLAERLSADPACRVTVVEAGLGPADAGVRTLTANGLQLPIGAASPLVRRYRTLLTADHGFDIVRGATVGGSGAVNGGYFCRALPEDFDEAALPGWSWADVVGHYRAIETDLDFPGPARRRPGPDSSHRRVPRQHSDIRRRGPRGGIPLAARPERRTGRRQHASRGGRGPAEHRRRHPYRPGGGLPGTRHGPAQPHRAHGDPGDRSADARHPGRRNPRQRTHRLRRTDGGPDRAVGRRHRVRAPADALRHRARGRATRGRHRPDRRSARGSTHLGPCRVGDADHLDRHRRGARCWRHSWSMASSKSGPTQVDSSP